MSDSARRRRFLVVTTSFPPDGAIGNLRTLRLLKHLAEVGADLEVLTLHPSTYRPGTALDPDRVAQVPPGVQVRQVRALRPLDRFGDFLKRKTASLRDKPATNPAVSHAPASTRTARPNPVKAVMRAMFTLPDAEVSWILPAILHGIRRRIAERPDVIYSSGPPFSAHVVGGVLAAVFRKPWVADFRDPWARAPWRDDRFAFEKRTWGILERWVVRRADQVLFATSANREDFLATYGASYSARFHVVPNGCDITDFEQLVPTPNSGQFVLLHAGSLYGARDPSPLFRAVAHAVSIGIIDPNRFRIRLIGRVGVSGVDLVRLVRELGIEQTVEFVQHLPRRQVLQEMVDASALLIVQPITKLSIPGKLYEYMAAGRPILALAEPDGDTAAVVRRTPGGIVVHPDDFEDLLRALTALTAAGHRRVDCDRSLYDGAHRAEEMAKILCSLIPSPTRSESASRDVFSVSARSDDA